MIIYYFNFGKNIIIYDILFVFGLRKDCNIQWVEKLWHNCCKYITDFI